MQQDSAMKLRDDGDGITIGEQGKRLAGPNRRAQVLRKASAQFAMTGLHGTTTPTFAQAAGISEAIPYVHFGNKTQLFRQAVEINIEARLRSLDNRLFSVAAQNQIDCIESMAAVNTCLAKRAVASHATTHAGERRTSCRAVCKQCCKIGIDDSRTLVEHLLIVLSDHKRVGRHATARILVACRNAGSMNPGWTAHERLRATHSRHLARRQLSFLRNSTGLLRARLFSKSL